MPHYLYLRLFLFSGFVLHKLIWEYMKRKDRVERSSSQTNILSFNGLMKIVKIAILLFLVIHTLFLEIFPIADNSINLRIIGIILYTLGLGVAITGRIQLGDNWANIEDYQVIPDQKLVQEGIYAYIRHPIYTGDILLILGLELALNSWLVLIVVPLCIYVVSQTKKEETILGASFPGYREYQRTTKKFIPFVI